RRDPPFGRGDRGGGDQPADIGSRPGGDPLVTGLVLASKSAARSAVLHGAGVAFEAVGSGVNETALKGELLAHDQTPAKIAIALAEAKAMAVAWERDELVIGCDQTLELGGKLFDKVENMDQ